MPAGSFPETQSGAAIHNRRIKVGMAQMKRLQRAVLSCTMLGSRSDEIGHAQGGMAVRPGSQTKVTTMNERGDHQGTCEDGWVLDPTKGLWFDVYEGQWHCVPCILLRD